MRKGHGDLIANDRFPPVFVSERLGAVAPKREGKERDKTKVSDDRRS